MVMSAAYFTGLNLGEAVQVGQVVVCLRKESALLYSVGASVFGTGHHLQTYVSVRISYAGGTYRHFT